jgi:type IV secretion system protein VirB10
MRILVIFLALVSVGFGQTTPASTSDAKRVNDPVPAITTNTAKPANQVVIPAGTRVPLSLKYAISTKGTREGDAVYAETTFPIAINDRVLVPAGTYVQGRISHIQRGGHIKGRAEVLMHFTSLIYPSGYTVMLPGSIENSAGVDRTTVKDKEGTIQKDSEAGHKAGTVASAAGTGAIIGGLSNGVKGGLIGAGAGGAVGMAIASLSRGKDIQMMAGTTFEMVIERDVALDGDRIRR